MSWWEHLTRDEFAKQAVIETARMQASVKPGICGVNLHDREEARRRQWKGPAALSDFNRGKRWEGKHGEGTSKQEMKESSIVGGHR